MYATPADIVHNMWRRPYLLIQVSVFLPLPIVKENSYRTEQKLTDQVDGEKLSFSESRALNFELKCEIGVTIIQNKFPRKWLKVRN